MKHCTANNTQRERERENAIIYSSKRQSCNIQQLELELEASQRDSVTKMQKGSSPFQFSFFPQACKTIIIFKKCKKYHPPEASRPR